MSDRPVTKDDDLDGYDAIDPDDDEPYRDPDPGDADDLSKFDKWENRFETPWQVVIDGETVYDPYKQTPGKP